MIMLYTEAILVRVRSDRNFQRSIERYIEKSASGNYQWLNSQNDKALPLYYRKIFSGNKDTNNTLVYANSHPSQELASKISNKMIII